MLASSIPLGPAQPPAAITIKVLRRAGLDARQQSIGGSTAASSSAPSKATSDAGQETNSEEGITSPMESTPGKDKSKLTREEREAQYKAARERIFGDFQEPIPSESVSTGEHSASLSRSSSSSGKRKTRKAKTPKDDSFEARSAFIPSYTPMNMPNMHQQYQPQYTDQTYQGSYQSSDPYGPNMNYGTTPTQSFPGYDPNMSFNGPGSYTAPHGNNQFSPSESWGSMQPAASSNYYNYTQPQNSYQQNMSPMAAQVNNQYMQQPHLGMQQNQPWLNSQYQNHYPQQPVSGNTNPASWSAYQANSNMSNSQPYAYGHLPGQNYNGNPPYNPQHPVPGSYSRSLFNPQTRSFVPNNAPSRNGGRNGRKKLSPSSSQNRVTGASKPFGSDASLTNSLPPGSRGFDKGMSHSSSPQPKEDSLQQKYGAPAHLPKKPPPSQVFPSYDMESIMNTNSAPGSNPVIVNEGGTVASGSNAAGTSSA